METFEDKANRLVEQSVHECEFQRANGMVESTPLTWIQASNIACGHAADWEVGHCITQNTRTH